MKKLILIWSLFFPLYLAAQTNIPVNTRQEAVSLVEEWPINTNLNERDFALSPDGMEIFYTLQSPYDRFQTILYIRKGNNGKWSKPEIAPFANTYNFLEPAFSPDGKKLFFSSNRPLTGDKAKDFDIWWVEKINGKWSEPQNVGGPVNTSADEFYPSITQSGNLYYTAAYKDAVGKEDIYLAAFVNGIYKTPIPLDTAINSKMYEFNAFVSPDEQFIIFTSYGRKDDKGGGDLYMSRRDAAGKWEPAKNLAFLNSDKLDFCPFVSFDKKKLFFTSDRNALKETNPLTYDKLIKQYAGLLNGGGNIWWISFDEVLQQFENL
jgi:hypothetical protein